MTILAETGEAAQRRYERYNLGSPAIQMQVERTDAVARAPGSV
jgi:hypothetical protein